MNRPSMMFIHDIFHYINFKVEINQQDFIVEVVSFDEFFVCLDFYNIKEIKTNVFSGIKDRNFEMMMYCCLLIVKD